MDKHDLLPIGVVAERSNVAVSALRFYEDKGLIRSVRTPGGRRQFSRHVLRRVAFVQAAQQVGLSLDEIRTALADLPHDAAPTTEQWSELASAWRPRLDAEIRQLERLRDRLDDCIGCGCLSLETCSLRNPSDEVAVRGGGPRYLLDDDGPAASRTS
jgi:MerR family transcriptional regulator, redox-sensitive transcriptional activator SoxR